MSRRQEWIPIICSTELATWTTKHLLGRLQSLRKLHETPDLSDFDQEKIRHLRESGIAFKSDQNWKDAYVDLKELLSKREHIG